jgi:uncharacterized protein (DUF433 family)
MGAATLTKEQVREIRRRHTAGESHATIARDYPVTLPTIYKIVNYERWRGVSDVPARRNADVQPDA